MPTDARMNVASPSSRAPTMSVPRSIDPALEALDPDRQRPTGVLASEDLTLSFGPKMILSDVNMAFTRATITALIGPTGSGKSTFLRTINRLNDRVPGFKREGDVKLDGQSIWALHGGLFTLRRQVGMMFQRANPFPMSIADNVVAGAKANRIAKGKQLDVVAETRLREVGCGMP
jgi:phosphate transport system ATP-binding protein